jgi:hypothetical protein
VIYLTGSISRDLIDFRSDVGLLVSPRRGDVVDLMFCHWAADNDCFSGTFDLDRFLAFLAANRRYSASCLFANAPDVLADPRATCFAERATP